MQRLLTIHSEIKMIKQVVVVKFLETNINTYDTINNTVEMPVLVRS